MTLLFILFGFRCFANVELAAALVAWSNPNQSNRSDIQWYFPLWWVFSAGSDTPAAYIPSLWLIQWKVWAHTVYLFMFYYWNQSVSLQFGASATTSLMFAKLPILNPADCDQYVKGNYNFEKEKMLCVGYLDVSWYCLCFWKNAKCLWKCRWNGFDIPFQNNTNWKSLWKRMKSKCIEIIPYLPPGKIRCM